MIGTRPSYDLVPLDYRYALDASMSWLKSPTIVRCNAPWLLKEVKSRFPHGVSRANSALWVEPLRSSWSEELERLAARLSSDGVLVIVASRPLARLLPERHPPQRVLLGEHPAGIRRLCKALRRANFVVEANVGIHSLQAMLLNTLSQQVARWADPALGDRLHFAARLRYATTGRLVALSTVALLVARKEG